MIGRGRLIADMTMEEFVRSRSGESVRVDSPQAGLLGHRLREMGATVDTGPDGTLTVRGVDAKAVGKLAASHGVVLYQLVSEQSSLEAAFMELTRESVDYRAVPTGLAESAR
ncbi:MAG: hypothetical protein ACRDPY_21910 [Streptosporangiaceae bacterium]